MKSINLLRLWCFLCSIFCLTEAVKMKKKLRVRRQSCDMNETYIHNGIVCCLCPKGYHLKEHCTQPRTDPVCEPCEKGLNYKNSQNSDKNCDPCTVCDKRGYMEDEVSCTPYNNAVCRCQNGYFCDKGDECKVCYECDKCENVKFPCNATSNTVCGENTSDGSKGVAAVVVPLIVIALAAGLVACYMWKKQKLCFKKSSVIQTVNPQETERLKDVDLARFLPEIAQKLSWKTVKKVTRQTEMLTEVEIENLDLIADIDERTFKALDTWYQKHGINGAYQTLIDNLIKSNHKTAADQVKAIVNQ